MFETVPNAWEKSFYTRSLAGRVSVVGCVKIPLPALAVLFSAITLASDIGMEVHLTFHASNEFRMKLLRSSYCYLPLEMHVKSVGLKCAEHNSLMMQLSEVIDRKSTQATALYLLHKTTFCQEHSSQWKHPAQSHRGEWIGKDERVVPEEVSGMPLSQ